MRKKPKRWVVTLLPLIVFILLAGLFLRGLHLNPRQIPSALLGKSVPDFSVSTLQGKVLSNRDLLGKVYLLNVWASWCVSCRMEHGALMTIAKGEKVPIYGLNYKDKLNAAKHWLQTFGDPYRASLYDPQGKLGINFGVYGVPETFLIDKRGVIRYKQIGVIDKQVWQQELLPRIKQWQTSS